MALVRALPASRSIVDHRKAEHRLSEVTMPWYRIEIPSSDVAELSAGAVMNKFAQAYRAARGRTYITRHITYGQRASAYHARARGPDPRTRPVACDPTPPGPIGFIGRSDHEFRARSEGSRKPG